MLGYSLEDLRLQLELGEASQVAWHSIKRLGSLRRRGRLGTGIPDGLF